MEVTKKKGKLLLLVLMFLIAGIVIFAGCGSEKTALFLDGGNYEGLMTAESSEDRIKYAPGWQVMLEQNGYSSENIETIRFIGPDLVTYYKLTYNESLTKTYDSLLKNAKKRGMVKVYLNSNFTEIAFVSNYYIQASPNSAMLFKNVIGNGNSNLKNIHIGSFIFDTAEDVRGMFEGCDKITSLSLEGWDMSNVLQTENMFNFGTSSKIEYFVSPTNVKRTINIVADTSTSRLYNNKGEPVTSIPSSAKSVHYNREVQVTAYANNGIMTEKIGWTGTSEVARSLVGVDSPFYNICEATRLGYDLVGWTTTLNGTTFVTRESILKEDTTLYANWNQLEINFPTTWGDEIASLSYMTTRLSKNSLTKIEFKNTNTSNYIKIGTLSTGIDVYRNPSVITQIEFVWGKTINAPQDCSNLFNGLESLESIIFTNFTTRNVTDMSRMFYGCSQLNNITFNLSFRTSKVTNMKEMFCACQSLTSLDVSRFDTSKVTNMRRMFYNCEKLSFLNLLSFDTRKATDLTSMFFGTFERSSGTPKLNISSSEFMIDGITATETTLRNKTGLSTNVTVTYDIYYS